MRSLLRKVVNILDGTPAEYGQPGRGQSVVELALMLPILLILIGGIVEMGWFTNNYLILLEASRVGARIGTTLETDGTPISWERAPLTTPRGDLETRDAVYPFDRRASGNAWALARGGFVNTEDGNPVDDANACTLSDMEIGFYTRVACTTLNSMAPLDRFMFFHGEFAMPERYSNPQYGITPDPLGPPVPTNDIVVSVFSLNSVPTATDCGSETCDTIEAREYNVLRPFNDSSQEQDFRDRAPMNPGGGRNPLATQIMVTGRFPSNANECSVDDHRDPFDINDNKQMDAWEVDETRMRVLNDGYMLYDGNGSADANATDKNQRGFALTGEWVTDSGCFGSEWDIRRIERLVNLNDTNLYESDFAQLPDRQGLVLVEIFYRHELLIDMPFFGRIFAMMGSGGSDDSGYIRVWAAFPLSTTYFALDFTQTCDDLLVYSSAPYDVYQESGACPRLP